MHYTLSCPSCHAETTDPANKVVAGSKVCHDSRRVKNERRLTTCCPQQHRSKTVTVGQSSRTPEPILELNARLAALVIIQSMAIPNVRSPQAPLGVGNVKEYSELQVLSHAELPAQAHKLSDKEQLNFLLLSAD